MKKGTLLIVPGKYTAGVRIKRTQVCFRGVSFVSGILLNFIKIKINILIIIMPITCKSICWNNEKDAV